MTKEEIKELLREKKIWDSHEMVDVIENEKSYFSSEISDKNKHWRFDIKAEDILPEEMVSDCTFIDPTGGVKKCQMVELPIFRNNNLSKDFSQISSESLKNKLKRNIIGNFSKVNLIIEHRPSAVDGRVVDAVFYTVYGLPIN
jgi:hypothetical protein